MKRYVNLVKNIANWPVYLGHKVHGGERNSLTFKTRAGLTIEVPVRILHEFKTVFFDECYTEAMPHRLRPGSDIIDVGANIGSFSFFAASRFPGSRILAFEPEPTNFAQLSRNAALNPGCIQPLQMAVAGSSGEVRLFGGDAGSLTTGASIVEGDHHGPSLAVKALSLADVFATFDVERCGLLKLDCEGAEFPILYEAPEAILQRIDQMVMEVHATAEEGPKSRRGIIAHLHARGFRTGNSSRHDLLWAWR